MQRCQTSRISICLCVCVTQATQRLMRTADSRSSVGKVQLTLCVAQDKIKLMFQGAGPNRRQGNMQYNRCSDTYICDTHASVTHAFLTLLHPGNTCISAICMQQQTTPCCKAVTKLTCQ